MSVESRLTFSLIESSRRKGKDGAARAYRAVLKREKPLGTDEVIKECVEGAGLEQKMAGQVKRNFEMVLDSMISHTLQDGRGGSGITFRCGSTLQAALTVPMRSLTQRSTP